MTGPAPASAAGSPAAAVDAPGRPAEELIRELYRQHALRLVRMAKLLLRDQPSAEDAVQEAFIGLYRALPRLTDPGKVEPYLRVAVLNQARSMLRSRQRAALLRVPPEPPGPSAEAAALAAEDQREVLAAVGRLPRRAREVLVLRYYLGLSEQQIAADLGISRGTVSSTAARALAALAREFQEQP